MSYETKIILDSVSPAGGRLTTFQFTLPRIVLAEFNTHRMFSRNSASSRAIPVEKMLARVQDDPFVPQYWGKNQKGMQADEELLVGKQRVAQEEWLNARNHAVDHAKAMLEIGVHKQLTNRLLEPFNWHTIVCTATEYDNYFGLRDHKDAAPEIRDSAHEAQELYRKNNPLELEAGAYHLPYVAGYDLDQLLDDFYSPVVLCNVSIGRCAAVSYVNQENIRDPEGDIKRAVERLLPGGHMSPFEHVAESLSREQWREVANEQCRQWVENRVPVGNLWGWHQVRKKMTNEHNFKLVARQ